MNQRDESLEVGPGPCGGPRGRAGVRRLGRSPARRGGPRAPWGRGGSDHHRDPREAGAPAALRRGSSGKRMGHVPRGLRCLPEAAGERPRGGALSENGAPPGPGGDVGGHRPPGGPRRPGVPLHLRGGGRGRGPGGPVGPRAWVGGPGVAGGSAGPPRAAAAGVPRRGPDGRRPHALGPPGGGSQG